MAQRATVSHLADGGPPVVSSYRSLRGSVFDGKPYSKSVASPGLEAALLETHHHHTGPLVAELFEV
jgi:hypothetical protein